MTKVLSFVEIDVPEYPYTERAAGFDGTNDYLTRGSGFTSEFDSKKWTFSCWVYVSSGLGGRLLASATSVGGGTGRTRAALNYLSNRFGLAGYNSSGTQILSLESIDPIFAGRWYHCMGSVDMSDSSKKHLYIDGKPSMSTIIFENDTIDFTLADWAVGGYPDGSNLLNGAIAELWSAPGVYIDLSQASNRKKFLLDPRAPASLGDNGDTPTGDYPMVYLTRLNGLDQFQQNLGYGGGFTVNGSLGDFDGGSVDIVYRFASPTSYLPKDIESIPSIDSISYSPARISLGKNLGERANLQVQFSDHKHIFGSESFSAGTFWGKWRARYGIKLRGKSIRWIQGTLGQSIGDMDTRHFVVESTNGPTFGGKYNIEAKDILKLADGNRSQAPLLSSGFLQSDITAGDGSAVLSPTGIGDDEYASSGYLAIGGTEIVSFTRSGNSLTLTGRGQLNTTAEAHSAGDRVQTVLRYSGEDPADIINDLLTTYAGVPDTHIPLTTWQAETDSYLQRLFTATIPEPVSVNQLISELIEQAALAVWWDPEAELVRLRVLKDIPTDSYTFDQDSIIQNSFAVAEQPRKRISQVWTYFGQRNSLKPLDEKDNYRSVEITADLDSEADYGTAEIKKIFSRWIPFGGRLIAQRVNDIQLGRFVDPPRKFNFSVFRRADDSVEPMLGGGYQIKAWPLQTVDGEDDTAPIQIVRQNPLQDRYEVEAEEMLFTSIDPVDLQNRVIIIDSSANNLNLRTMHDQIYPEPESGSPTISVDCYIEESAIVGSSSTGTPAFNVGSWPAGVVVTIYLRGRIQGAGGAGGQAGTDSDRFAKPGQNGGDALYTRNTVTLVLNEGFGQIWAGGGGGAGGIIKDAGKIAGGGGGGAGANPGAGGPHGNGSSVNDGYPGTTEAGGDGGPRGSGEALAGADGGDPGQSGDGNGFQSGGSAGTAIDGISYVTKTGTGDIRGSQVN